MRIAVYPGSFDPLHVGHLNILHHLVACKRFDGVYLVVSPQNPLKERSKALNARERFESAVRTVARYPELSSVRVDGIELGMDPPHYTIRTLDALSKREPDNSFTLVIGADNLELMRHWRDYGRILSEYGVMVFPRDGVDADDCARSLQEENPAYIIGLVDALQVDMSSSRIREAESLGLDTSALRM